MAKLYLSSPWVLFYREVKAMFEDDPDVNVIYDDSESEYPKLRIYVDSEFPLKAQAIEKLLPSEKTFGRTTMTIFVVPSNIKTKVNGRYTLGRANRYSRYNTFDPENLETPVDIFNSAFKFNRAYRGTEVIYGIYNNPIYYAVFAKEVVQYFTDDLGDLNGIRSTLYQDIAKEIFEPMDGVHYCTVKYDDKCDE